MPYPRLEIGYDFGANNEISFKTVVIELGNGSEQRSSQYQSPLAQIQFGDRNLSTHQMHQSFQYLQQFFRERKGSQDAFAVRDWSDYEARSQPTRRLTSTTCLLEKIYGDLACPVRLPMVASLEIFVNDVKLVSGYSVNVDEGIITFNMALNASDIIAWSGEFDRLCRFSEDKLEVRNLGYSPDMDVHILQISSLRAREVPNKYPPRIVGEKKVRVNFYQEFDGMAIRVNNFTVIAPAGVPIESKVYLVEGSWDDRGTVGNFVAINPPGEVFILQSPVIEPIAENTLSVSGTCENLIIPHCAVNITLEWRWGSGENGLGFAEG